jgi:hypothetical protein
VRDRYAVNLRFQHVALHDVSLKRCVAFCSREMCARLLFELLGKPLAVHVTGGSLRDRASITPVQARRGQWR